MEYQAIDWNGVWKDLYAKNVETRGKGECATIWESRAKAGEFLSHSEKDPGRINRVIDALGPNRDFRILDIGAGPGTIAVPLAHRCRQVTAVEPAAGMADVMEDHALRTGTKNLKIVRKRWEDVDPATDLDGPYDIVFACHSLGMPDIRAAIEKMNSVASGRVFLFWFGGITSWEKPMVDLWPDLHGKAYHAGPKADVLFNVLWSMGIVPDVASGPLDNPRFYPTIASAVRDLRWQFGITSPGQVSVLKTYLKRTMEKRNGQYYLPGITTGVRLSWGV